MDTYSFLAGLAVGVVIVGLLVRLSDRWYAWRAPNSERAFRKMVAACRKHGYNADDARRWGAVADLYVSEYHPLLKALRSEGLMAEASLHVLDRLRLTLVPIGEGLPEYVHGEPPDPTSRKADERLDAANALPGVDQPAQTEDNLPPAD